TPATAKNQGTRTCYECGSLRHYKSECPIVKFHKRVDMIHGRMMASKPKTMQDAIEIAIKLRNKKISTLVECQTANKKRLDNTSKNNQNQQQPDKRQNTGRAYTARHGEKKHYNGAKPLCSKCNYHHDGPCAPKCHKCNRFSHLARDCRSSTSAKTTNTQKGTTGEILRYCLDYGLLVISSCSALLCVLCLAEKSEVRTAITNDGMRSSKPSKERFQEFANNSGVIGGEHFRFDSF
nr:hypothetical protein [Tanacetum cinerariifolium]